MTATAVQGCVYRYQLWSDKAKVFDQTADALEVAGDRDTARLVRAFAEGYRHRAGNALLDAAEAVRKERAP